MSDAPAISGYPRVEYLDPAQLDDNPLNWKLHPQEQLEIIAQSVERFGHLQTMGTYNIRTRKLLNGHARKTLYAGKGVVPIWVVDLPPEMEVEALLTLDPSGWCSQFDEDKLDDAFKGFAIPGGAAGQLFKGLKSKARKHKEQAGQSPLGDPNSIEISLDTLWPSDNVFGVPNLDAHHHALGAPMPVEQWGFQASDKYMRGTYHLYTWDDRLERLWKKPDLVLESGCKAVVEPNFTTTDQTSLAQALWHTFRKRWMARYWQAKGLRLFVDLNVSPELNRPVSDLNGVVPNLLGVPRGWPSFATHSHGVPEFILAEFEVAKEWSGREDPTFLVVGGGQTMKSIAREHASWVWVPRRPRGVNREEDAA